MTQLLNILFVCGRNKRRSPTAERVFRRDRRMNVRAVGLADTSPRRMKAEDLRWATLVLVMERKYIVRIREMFRDVDPMPEIASLNIPDDYRFMQPELVEALKEAVDGAIEEFESSQAGE